MLRPLRRQTRNFEGKEEGIVAGAEGRCKKTGLGDKWREEGQNNNA